MYVPICAERARLASGWALLGLGPAGASMIRTALFVAATPAAVLAHMSLVSPFPRNAVDKADPRWADGKWFPYAPSCPKSEQKYPSDPSAKGWNSQVPSGCVPNGTDGWGCNCANGTGQCNAGQSCLWFSQV